MIRIVPQLNHRLGQIVLVAQRAQAGRAQCEVFAGDRFQPQPTRAQDAQDVAARENQYVALNLTNSASRPGRHARRSAAVTRRLDSRRETIPSPGASHGFPPCAALRIRRSSIRADRDRLRPRAEARQLASAHGTLQRAGEDFVETQSLQPFAQPASVALTALGQRQIGKASVLTRDTPRGLTVPCEKNDGQCFAHDFSSSIVIMATANSRCPAGRSRTRVRGSWPQSDG